MKYQLIMIPNEPILVSDEEIKEGEPGYSINNATYTHFSHLGSSYGRKIIAGVKDLPSVDFSALSEEDCKKIGWVEKFDWRNFLLKKAEENNIKDKIGVSQVSLGTAEWACKQVEKTAQSLNEKKYSEEDIKNAYYNGWIDRSEGASFPIARNRYINEIHKPKEYNVEVEMDCTLVGLDLSQNCTPKITNNSIKITKIL